MARPPIAPKPAALPSSNRFSKLFVSRDRVRIPENPSPGRWEDCFANSGVVHARGAAFRTYSSDDVGGPLFVFVHGASYCGLSFALVGKLLREHLRVLTYDQRYHGHTTSESDCKAAGTTVGPLKLDIDTLIADLIAVVVGHLEQTGALDRRVVLVGHSLGGAVAAKAACSPMLAEAGIELVGLVVVDVVEGTAVPALSNMHDILASRPKSFSTLKRALEWAQSSRQPKNVSSALYSIPPTLRPSESGEGFVVRTDMTDSADFWLGWFTGLSNAFISAPCHAKALILANRDTMDTPLLTAHMQGVFSLGLVRNVGHAVHEDDPVAFATELLKYARQQRLAPAVASVPIIESVGPVPKLSL